MLNNSSKIVALLGPTNTGKTHLAIEKMLSFQSGIFGLPLRLLAREVYDKCAEKIGVEKVALITGEEKIIPSTANYFICTAESMPKEKVCLYPARSVEGPAKYGTVDTRERCFEQPKVDCFLRS